VDRDELLDIERNGWDALCEGSGDDAAALVYLGTARREDGEPFVGAMASVYQRVGGEWRLALYQQTPVVQG
jgi:hypothetical protein